MRELSFGFRRSSARKNGKREWTEGGEGVFIPLDPKNSRWANSYPETPGNPNFQPVNSTRTLRVKGSGVSGPIPGVSGLGRMKTHVLLFWVYIVAHKCLSRFSWAQDLNQNPWIKSLLIVRRTYTQISNIKSNSMSILWTPLFHFLFEGSYILTWFTYTNSPPAHTLNYTIKCTCVLSLTPKTT